MEKVTETKKWFSISLTAFVPGILIRRINVDDTVYQTEDFMINQYRLPGEGMDAIKYLPHDKAFLTVKELAEDGEKLERWDIEKAMVRRVKNQEQ